MLERDFYSAPMISQIFGEGFGGVGLGALFLVLAVDSAYRARFFGGIGRRRRPITIGFVAR